jgi:hypothetical protein
LWYVDHWSIGLDLKIIGRTIWSVLKREGIYSDEGIIVDEISRPDSK